MSQSDPTDNALAAIASILDQPQTPPAVDSPSPVDGVAIEGKTSGSEPVRGHGYAKFGPGPMAAIRFKWAVREHAGHYFVDETFGEHSPPQISGPMDLDAAIRLVDEREALAREGFENLRQEMAGRSAAASLVRRVTSET